MQHVLVEVSFLAIFVGWLFLRNWRATAIAAVAMPLSLIPTFAFMAAFSFSLNGITLLALTLVIGILVDDAIVEVENIEKRIEAGQTPYRAALIGADSIGLAVLATTATIIAVFAPVSVMPRSEERTSELQSLMRISYAVFCLKKKNIKEQQDIAS